MVEKNVSQDQSGEKRGRKMETLLLWLFYISSFYAFIPGIISRLFGYRVFRKGNGVPDFALTFDDGPDPQYTPRLLDILKKYDAKATFFVVGSHAESNPELIRRIHAEGHLIGIHNYVHRSNWVMRPGTVQKQIQRTNDIIYNLTGERSTYYRPPWGIVNLFDFSKRRQVKIVLWSAMFGDWREKLGTDRLAEKMLTRLNPGEVMLLHDCGTTPGADPEAPEHMLAALERTLIEAQKRGLKSIRIDDMIKAAEALPMKRLPLRKRVVVRLWLLWESCFHFLFRLQTVTPEHPWLHYRLREYQGEPVPLDGKITLTKGDPVIELHIDNRQLFELGVQSRSAAQLAIRMIRRMEAEMPHLARIISSDEELASAKALYGVSMINRGPEKFGFTIRDLPDGIFARMTKFYLSILLSIIHPAGGARLKVRSDALVPKMILMPVSQLLQAHGRSCPETKRAQRSGTGSELDDSLAETELPGVHAH
ncbi:Peptidoglycan-N-acetylmuramic acid deacetylase PdaA precursor [compost metagenome]